MMKLLTREEFYKGLGQALRQARVERGLSQAEVAKGINQLPKDPEWVLRRCAAMSVIVGHIRRQKKLTYEQVAERVNLPVEFVRDVEAAKIFNPEMYLVYCLSYGLGLPLSRFEKKVERLSRTELDGNDLPVRKRGKPGSGPQESCSKDSAANSKSNDKGPLTQGEETP